MSVYSLSDTVQYYQGCHIPTERKVSQKTQVKELLDLIATIYNSQLVCSYKSVVTRIGKWCSTSVDQLY